jgi:hypothetical protein
MKWYFKITRGYTAWYVGKGAFCFASVESNPIAGLISFIPYFIRVWRHRPVKVLKYRTKMQPPADQESVRAAAVSLGEPVPQMVAAHFGMEYTQQDEAAAVAILSGTDQDEVFTPRPGVEYSDCPECGQETCYLKSSSFNPGGSGCGTWNYECENPACGHTWHVSA